MIKVIGYTRVKEILEELGINYTDDTNDEWFTITEEDLNLIRLTTKYRVYQFKWKTGQYYNVLDL